MYLVCRILELALHHTPASQLRAFQLRDDPPAVAPRVEVALVLGQHLSREIELRLPDGSRGGGCEARGGLLEGPAAVVPEPVALGRLEKQGDGEGELGGYYLCVMFLRFVLFLSALRINTPAALALGAFRTSALVGLSCCTTPPSPRAVSAAPGPRP